MPALFLRTQLSGLRCALALDETIQNLGPSVVSAFIAETVGGASIALHKSVAMAGTDGDGLIVAPPFVIKENEIDLPADRLRVALRSVLGA